MQCTKKAGTGGSESIMAAKVVEFGINHSISIKFPDAYFDILFAMAQMQGKDVKDLAMARLKQIIIEDVIFDEGYYGELLSQGWEETLKGDPYYENVH